MKTTGRGEWDFNEWLALAKRDPAAFELRRREAVQALIARSPQERQERLRRLQWRVDRVRERSASPLGSCMSLYRMMWDSLLGQGGLAEALIQAATPGARGPQRRAVVIPLDQRQRPR